MLMSQVDLPGIAEPPATASPHHDPFAALRFGDFRLLVLGSFLAVVAEQMLEVAIGFELYERTHSALALRLVGLVEIVPVLLLALPAGHVADRLERKWVVVGALSVVAASRQSCLGCPATSSCQWRCWVCSAGWTT
jgi:MFS family permease